ncbi:hypothetical protein DFS34DRAFT_653526 [Phlyctochytrium arcticum]|nr:hypothetical protein DFS34DRAFT_653526 [Phlyctochytrium arcticum]
MNQIIWISPTVFYDEAPKSLAKYDNVSFRDNIDNDSLQNILDIQMMRAEQDPKKSLLLVLDDCGNIAKSKELRKILNKIYTTGRHYSLNLLCVFQDRRQLDGIQFTNSTQWCIFNWDPETFEILASKLATVTFRKKALTEFFINNTKERYSFVYIHKKRFHKKFEDDYVT